METLEAIFTRRSVRKFHKDQVVEQDKVDTILRAGMIAPSTANQQPWHFLVINEREILDKIPTVHPYAQMVLQAPLAIISCVDMNLDVHAGFWVQDLSNASMNILLAARDLGLGAVWLGVYPREDRVQALQELFNLPENIVPFNIIPMGYSDMEQKKMDRFIPERVHYNEW